VELMARTTGYAEISRALTRYSRLWHDTTGQVLEREAAVIQSRIKAEHRWRNRTGFTESTIQAGVVDLGDIEGFRLSAGYGGAGVYLEYAMQQRWAVLEPVMRSQWPSTARKVAAAIRSASGGQQ
jgi:hypothetical protein